MKLKILFLINVHIKVTYGTFLFICRNEIECKILQKRLQNSLQAPFESTDENMPNSGFEFGIKKPSSYQEDLPNEVHTISTECNEGLISIPALMNMLHTSSMQVLKVNFWKNTFKFR